MKLNKRGKLLITAMGAMLLLVTPLMASQEGNTKYYDDFNKSKVSTKITKKVLIPKEYMGAYNLDDIEVLDIKETEKEFKDGIIPNAGQFEAIKGYTFTYEDGFCSRVTTTDGDVFDYVGLSKHQGKNYLSYKKDSDKELNHIYLENVEVVDFKEFKEDKDKTKKEFYKSLGSIVGILEKIEDK